MKTAPPESHGEHNCRPPGAQKKYPEIQLQRESQMEWEDVFTDFIRERQPEAERSQLVYPLSFLTMEKTHKGQL